MNASRPVPHDPRLRFDAVNRLTAHLLQYPQDLVDTKRLLKYFQVSAGEFQQALLSLDNLSHSINNHWDYAGVKKRLVLTDFVVNRRVKKRAGMDARKSATLWSDEQHRGREIATIPWPQTYLRALCQ